MADAVAGFGLVGIGLGWPAAVSVGLLVSGARLFRALMLGISPRRRHPTLLAYICPAAFLQICLWRGLDALAFWPNDASGNLAIAAAVTMVFVLTWQASVLERLASRASPHSDEPVQ